MTGRGSKSLRYSMPMMRNTNYTFTVEATPQLALYYLRSDDAQEAELTHEPSTSYTVEYSPVNASADAVLVLNTTGTQTIRTGTLTVTTQREDWDINPSRAFATCPGNWCKWDLDDLGESDNLYFVVVPEESSITYTIECRYYKSFVAHHYHPHKKAHLVTCFSRCCCCGANEQPSIAYCCGRCACHCGLSHSFGLCWRHNLYYQSLSNNHSRSDHAPLSPTTNHETTNKQSQNKTRRKTNSPKRKKQNKKQRGR